MRLTLSRLPAWLLMVAVTPNLGTERTWRLGASSLEELPAASVAMSRTADSLVAVKFRQRYALGGAGNLPLEVKQIAPREVAADARGQIYLLDRAQYRVLVFDAKGRQVTSLGRKGTADGEFLEPVAIGGDSRGAIFVADAQREVLVGFDYDGYLLPTLSTKLIGVVHQVAYLDVKEIILSAELRDSLVLLRVKRETAPERLAVAALPEKQLVSWKHCGMLGQSSAPLFWPNLLWTASGKSIAINEGGSSRISAREALKPDTTFDHELPAEAANGSVARRILGDSIRMTLRQRSCAVATEQVAEQAGVSAKVPAYASLLYDYRGNLWALRTLRAGESNRADLFTHAGGYAGTVDLGRIRPVAFTGPTSVVSLETDPTGTHMLVVYDVQLPKPAKK